jgi:hypothetical protein
VKIQLSRTDGLSSETDQFVYCCFLDYDVIVYSHISV